MELDEQVILFVTWRDIAVAAITWVIFKVLGFFAAGPIAAFMEKPIETLGKVCSVAGVGFLLGSGDRSAPEDARNLYALIGILFLMMGGLLMWLSDRMKGAHHDCQEGDGEKPTIDGVERMGAESQPHQNHDNGDRANLNK